MMNQSENVKMIIIQRQIKWENYEVRQSPLSWLRQNLQKVNLAVRYYGFVVCCRLQAVALRIFLNCEKNSKFSFSLIDFQPEHREQIVSQAILKLFKETDLDLEPNLPKNDLLSEVDHLPHSKIDSILGDVKGKYWEFCIL